MFKYLKNDSKICKFRLFEKKNFLTLTINKIES